MKYGTKNLMDEKRIFLSLRQQLSLDRTRLLLNIYTTSICSSECISMVK